MEKAIKIVESAEIGIKVTKNVKNDKLLRGKSDKTIVLIITVNLDLSTCKE